MFISSLTPHLTQTSTLSSSITASDPTEITLTFSMSEPSQSSQKAAVQQHSQLCTFLPFFDSKLSRVSFFTHSRDHAHFSSI